MTVMPLASDPLRPAPQPSPDAVWRGRRTLLLLAAVCVLPVIASYLAFYLWQPGGRVNHGELIPPVTLADVPLAPVGEAAPLHRADFERRWTLLMVAPAECDRLCADALYAMRQARLMQGKEQGRVALGWLVDGEGRALPAVLDAHPDLRLARLPDAWQPPLARADAVRIYLVDPLGNAMLRYQAPRLEGADALTRGMAKDLERLLKYSQLGRGGASR